MNNHKFIRFQPAKIPTYQLEDLPRNPYDKIHDYFMHALNTDLLSEKSKKETQIKNTFHAFLFSLQFYSAVIAKNDMKSFYKMQAIDLNFLKEGYFRLAHFSTPQFIPVDELTQVLGKSLYLQLLRKYSDAPGGRNRLGVMPNKYLVDYVYETPKTKKQFSSAFYSFMKTVCQNALGGKQIKYEQFKIIIGSHFYPYFGDEWFSHLQRQYKYNPAPLSQLDDFHKLKNAISKDTITQIANSDLSDNFLMHIQLSNQRSPKEVETLNIVLGSAEEQEGRRIKYNPIFSDIKNLINKYYIEKKPITLRNELYNLAIEKERKNDIPFKKWANYKEQLYDTEIGAGVSNTFLYSTTAHWLREILKKNRKLEKETLLGYLRTIQILLNEHPDSYVFDLNEKNVLATSDNRSYQISTHNALATHFHSYQSFMKSIGIISKVIPKSKIFDYRIISRNTYMLTNNDVENILGVLKKWGETDEISRLSYYVVIIEILFAFRVQTTTMIKLNSFEYDLREYGRITITCPPNKKRKAFTSSPIQSNLDETLFKELIEYSNERKQFCSENNIKINQNTELFDSEVFNLNEHNKRMDLIFDYLKIQVRKITETEEEFLYIENNGEEHLINYPTRNHAFRHYAANRWLSKGIDIHMIRDYLNHKQVTTTINNYLHGLHFIVFEKFKAIDRTNLYETKLKKKTLLSLLGLNNTANNQLKKIINNFESKQMNAFSYQIKHVNLLCSFLLDTELSELQIDYIEDFEYSGKIFIEPYQL